MKKSLLFALVIFSLFFACAKEQYKVGDTIYPTHDGADVSYQWLIDDILVSTENSYTLNASDLCSFVTLLITDKAGRIIQQDKFYFSTLPVVYINTDDPNVKINRNNYVDATIEVDGYQGSVLIKGRGTSSWHYDKKPYKLKFSKSIDLFGFGKSKHYVLLANYLDISLMRNTVGFQLSKEMGLCAVDTVWVV